MFTTVHKNYVLLFAFCALFFSSTVPQVVYSEEELPTTTEAFEASAGTGIETSLSGLYPVDGVPGGDVVIGDFVVGPGKIDLTLKPGQSKIVEMTVTNRTGERRIFNVTTEDAKGSQDPDTPVLLLGNDRGPYSLKDYLSVPHTRFELGHNERARIPVTISIPADAEPGGLYGSVLIDTVAKDADTNEVNGTVPQSSIIARIGTLFFITVPGDIERSGELKSFATISEKKFYQKGPIDFAILFENTGSMHLAPYGELRIRNIFGEEVGYLTLESWFVFPQSVRLREVSWDPEMLFGQYTATLEINRSYDNVIDTMSFTFWVLPWKLVLGAFSVLFAILFIIRAFFKNFEFKRK